MVATSEFTVDKAHVEHLVQEPILDFSLSDGCNEGDGVASSLKSIHVKTQSGQDIHLVHKTLDKMDAQQREFSEKFHIFQTEILFYDTLIPWLEKLAKSRGQAGLLPFPKFFAGHVAADHNEYVCVEDVRPQGFRMKDKFLGLNFEETELVMAKLAEFHALTYFLVKWEGEQVFGSKLRLLDSDLSKLAEGAALFSGAMTSAVGVMEKRNHVLASKMKVLQETSDLKTIFDTTYKTDSAFFPVIIHGDLWSNNILIKYDAAGSPTDLKFIDFQLCRRGNIFEDLQYFFFTSTTPDFRKKYLYQVLNSYYDTFMTTLQHLNCPPPTNFTRGFFIDSFRDCYIPAFRYMTFAIPLQIGTPLSEVMKMLAAGPVQESETENGHGINGGHNSSVSHDSEIQNGHSNGTSRVAEARNGHSNGGVRNSASQEAENPIRQENGAPGEIDPFAMMLMGFRLALETSPRALERLESIAQELVDLKLL